VSVAGRPDAGIWEFRTEWRPQTFSSLMCWAAADRMQRIAAAHRLADVKEFALAVEAIRDEVLTRAVDVARGTLVADYGGAELDAALLQAVTLRLLAPDDPRAGATIDAVRADLSMGAWLRCYRADDGFGAPTVAFTLCTFWLVEALAAVGRTAEARELLAHVGEVRAPLGLLSEDVDPATGEMWGNFPQAYSHMGLIHAAFAASPAWADLW